MVAFISFECVVLVTLRSRGSYLLHGIEYLSIEISKFTNPIGLNAIIFNSFSQMNSKEYILKKRL